jgi:hypothetical protein
VTEPQQLPSRSAAPEPRTQDPPPDAHDGSTRPLPVPVPEAAGHPGARGADTDTTLLGFPAEPPEDESSAAGASAAGPAPGGVAVAERPPTEAERAAGADDAGRGVVVLRRADRVAGIALVLAGVAAGLSLWLPWGQGVATAGLVPVAQGVQTLGSGLGALAASDDWAPLVVVTGGGVLFLLGLFLFRRARTHRLVGVLALLVAEAVTVGVLVVLARADWSPARLGPGAWCAVAVAVLGLFGALKATLTSPIVTVEPS